MIIPTSQATVCHAMRVMSSSRARSRWFSWTSRTSLMVLCWKPISLNWARRRRNSAACNRVQQSYIHQSDSNFCPCHIVCFLVKALWWILRIWDTKATCWRDLTLLSQFWNISRASSTWASSKPSSHRRSRDRRYFRIYQQQHRADLF